MKLRTASLGFNATLSDAPLGSNLFTQSVLYPEGQPGFSRMAAAKGCRRTGVLLRYKSLSGKQSRAADAGRSLR